jgi:hypothetical protein
MQSKKRVEPLDRFEIDVPITPADAEAQWRLRTRATMTPKEYLEWCSWLTRDSVSPARDFHTEVFVLPELDQDEGT